MICGWNEGTLKLSIALLPPTPHPSTLNPFASYQQIKTKKVKALPGNYISQSCACSLQPIFTSYSPQ